MNVEQPVIRPSRSRSAVALRRSYDLLLLGVAAVVLPSLLLVPLPVIRVPLGLAMALFAPGYALTLAIFARHDDADGVTRLALSFGLSVALLPVFALILDKLPWGIRPTPMALIVSVWLLLCCAIALWRRWLSPLGMADTPPPLALGRWWPTSRNALRSPSRRAFVVVMSILLLGTGLLLRAPAPGMTEFYLLGKAGLAEDYPRAAVVGEPLQVTLGITNREASPHTYRVEVWAVDPLQPSQRTLVTQHDPVTLAADQTQLFSMQWKMPQAQNDQQVEFLLFRNDAPQPYRSLQLWLNVVEPSDG